jgi:hypothetical protein
VPIAERAVMLGAVVLALVLRAAAGEPREPADPSSALLDRLSLAAQELDASYASLGRYEPDPARISGALAALPPPGYVLHGRLVSPGVRLLERADGAPRAAEPADLPGTVLLAIAPERDRSWLAIAVPAGRSGLLESGGRPLVILARAGSHGAPGRDPAVPVYPSAERRVRK